MRGMLDDIANAAPRRTQTELSSLLGCFLFSEDDVFKRIGVLSGGERNRYALAKMLLAPSNFLLLDEPTNHLDMRAKDVLLDALKEYNGTVVFVSHDRYFIDNLAQRIFEIEDGHVHVYPGKLRRLSMAQIGRPRTDGRRAGSAQACSRSGRSDSGAGSEKRKAARESHEGAENARAIERSGRTDRHARIANSAARDRAGGF